tara:strand:+ start:110 stop:565 length:456 start_codon:yes stop_codon:yes gene_type:complete
MTDKERKATKIFQGVLMYFPNAISEVARCSTRSNEQHNGPDAPVYWDMDKSKDEIGSLTRHLMDLASGDEYDEDGTLNLAKIAWRALGALERHLVGQEAYDNENFYKQKLTADGQQDKRTESNDVSVCVQDGQTLPHYSYYSVTTHTGGKV